MGKNKLKKFAEMQGFSNVIQCTASDLWKQSADERAISNLEIEIQGKWKIQQFNNGNPIVLELGCGRGEYTVGLAKSFEAKNFIGIDIKGARMWAGAKQAETEGITNAAFLRTNIELLPAFFAEKEVDELWITFPDPQMKKATKRLTSSFFMARYAKFLKDGGIVNLKTDSPFLFAYTNEMVKANNFEVLASTADLYADESIAADSMLKTIQTHYEKQWLERGKTIKYIAFRLRHQAEPYIEPDVEIEPDDYRSYGRFGRTGKPQE